MGGYGIELMGAAVVFVVILVATLRIAAAGAAPAPSRRPPPVEMSDDEVARRIARLEAGIAALVRPALKGFAEDIAPSPEASRIGGPTLWPEGRAMPERLPHMRCLVRIDLAALPPLPPLPAAGVLQVFLEIDDLWGCRFPSTGQDGFLAVLHEGVSRWREVPPAPVADATMALPLDRDPIPPEGLGLRWEAVEMPPPAADHRLRHLRFPWNIDGGIHDRVAREVLDPLEARRGRFDVLLLGHAGFTQEDFRGPQTHADLETLLAFSSGGGAFLWGDVGEASIMVPAADLAPLRLDRAVYYWDCS